MTQSPTPLDLDAIEARARDPLNRQWVGRQLASDLDALLSEVRKLREALESIAGQYETGEHSEYGAGYDSGIRVCAQIADDALKGTQP